MQARPLQGQEKRDLSRNFCAMCGWSYSKGDATVRAHPGQPVLRGRFDP